MSIKATCPACGTQATIDKTLYGKKLRCANSSCRSMFRYHENGQAELVDMIEKSSPPPGGNWNNAPPPVQSSREGDWIAAPPPVSGNSDYQEYAQPIEAVEAEVSDDEPVAAVVDSYSAGDYSYGKKRRRGLPLVIAMVVVMLAILGGGLYFFFSKKQGNLDLVKKEGIKLVSEGKYSDALQRWELLRSKVTNPQELKEIDFNIEWCKMQLNIDGVKDYASSAAATDGLIQFNSLKRSDPLIKDFRKKLFETAQSVGKGFFEQSKADPKEDDLKRNEKLIGLMEDHAEAIPEKETSTKAISDVKANLTALKVQFDANQDKAAILKEMQSVVDAKDLSRLDELEQNYDGVLKKHPVLRKDEGLKQSFTKLREDEISWIKLTRTDKPALKVDEKNESRPIGASPSMVSPAEAVENNDVVLALGRGTLYGLKARTGEPKWLLSVGIDLQELPPRIGTGSGQNDVAFVVGSESDKKATRYFVQAVDISNGSKIWKQELLSARKSSEPSIAGATYINGVLYIPLIDGTINVVDAKDGRHLGHFYLGAKLTIPPTLDAVNNRLFIPADKRRVFILDLKANANPVCPGVIYTNHAIGGIRSPVSIHKDMMSVAMSVGNGGSEVQLYSVPKVVAQSKLASKFAMPGHIWFTAYQDGETLGYVSDAGQIFLLGLNQGQTGTQSIVPLNNTPMPLPGTSGEPAGKTQVSHVVLGDWWVISAGKLVRNHFDPLRNQMVSLATDTLNVGNPLHQSSISPDGRYVIMVTQTKDQAIATAVDRSTAQIVWQRQLGLVPAAEPVSLKSGAAVLDRGGGVFLFQASSEPAKGPLAGGKWPAAPLPGTSGHRIIRLPDSDDFINLSYDPVKELIKVRKIVGEKAQFIGEYKIPSPPSGQAVCDGESLLVPCRDGKIYIYQFGSSAPTTPLTWRDPEALPGSVGHLTLVNPLLVVATDGARKLLRLEKVAGGSWRKVSGNDRTFPGKIISVPAVVGKDSVTIADDTNTIHLIGLTGIATTKEFAVAGNIVRGPFALSDRILGCVFNTNVGHCLWWTDTSGAAAEGVQYQTVGIVGVPVLMKDGILVAEWKRVQNNAQLQIAMFSWLDPKTGQSVRQEVLPRGLAPASGVVPLGESEAFAPMSDGTIRILK